MKLKFRRKTSARTVSRLTKKIRIRKIVNGTAERPRLVVFRSNSHMYASIIDDVTGNTLVTTSSLTLKDKKSGKALAEAIGQAIAKAALEKKIESVVFDRNGFVYHGRVKALAEGARAGGLKF